MTCSDREEEDETTAREKSEDAKQSNAGDASDEEENMDVETLYKLGDYDDDDDEGE